MSRVAGKKDDRYNILRNGAENRPAQETERKMRIGAAQETV